MRCYLSYSKVSYCYWTLMQVSRRSFRFDISARNSGEKLDWIFVAQEVCNWYAWLPSTDRILPRYFLFLLSNVVFIFLLASTYLDLVYELANFPAKIPEKLAKALQGGQARNFFLSYVILQGMSISMSVDLKLRDTTRTWYHALTAPQSRRGNSTVLPAFHHTNPSWCVVLAVIILYS